MPGPLQLSFYLTVEVRAWELRSCCTLILMVELLDSSEKIKTFYLVRHGETEATAKGRICGHSEVSLSEHGLEQVELAADWFYNIPIDTIFSSPLNRAVQTTDIIAKAIQKPTYLKHSGLVEKKEGEWEGKTYWELRDQDAKSWEKWSNDPINFAPPNGESVQDFVARVGRAMKDIIANYDSGNKIILSTHAGVIRSVIMQALDIPVDNFFRIDIPVASITRVDWSESYSTLKFCGLVPEQFETLVV